MSRLALQGAALFAFIPLVLFLYLQLPLGPGPSLLLGLALMLGHRFLASPWMARHALERCLWCGRTGAMPARLPIRAGGRDWTLAACGEAHAVLARRFFTFVARWRAMIALGIFLPLALLLAGTAALALGHPFLAPEVNRQQFRVVVALTVVGVSLAYRTALVPDPRLRSPFPLHNLFLLGIRATLWVFRIVGAVWLTLGALALARR